jgi:hypothetical protein
MAGCFVGWRLLKKMRPIAAVADDEQQESLWVLETMAKQRLKSTANN